MTTVQDVIQRINEKAPFALQESWDNSGFLVGHREQEVSTLLVALDITPETILEAEAEGCELIVSHHPVIFHPVKRLTDESYDANRLLMLVERHIAAICAHTCLDAVCGGVNDVLAEKCGLKDTTLLKSSGTDGQGRPYGIGRIGQLDMPMEFTDYLQLVQSALKPNGLRYVSGGKPVRRVAVGGGACGSMLRNVLKVGCDTFVTSDLKYDHFLEAKAMGLNLIDAGHFPTENPVMEPVAGWLRERLPEVRVLLSSSHKEVISYR